MTPFVGQNTDVDAAAEVLIGTATLVAYGIRIKALPGNTGVVYVGLDNTVSATTGYPLSASEECAFDAAWIPRNSNNVPDANAIYVIGSAANQGVSYWGV